MRNGLRRRRSPFAVITSKLVLGFKHYVTLQIHYDSKHTRAIRYIINMNIASDERARAFVYAHRVLQTHYNPARHVHASNLDVS